MTFVDLLTEGRDLAANIRQQCSAKVPKTHNITSVMRKREREREGGAKKCEFAKIMNLGDYCGTAAARRASPDE